jgi:hypothetical protein
VVDPTDSQPINGANRGKEVVDINITITITITIKDDPRGRQASRSRMTADFVPDCEVRAINTETTSAAGVEDSSLAARFLDCATHDFATHDFATHDFATHDSEPTILHQ